MSCTNEHSEKISKMLLTNSNKKYQFIYNSSKNSRGVGMLLDSSLPFTILSVHKCSSENILGVKLVIENSPLLLLSIYGPNDNDISFYSELASIIRVNSEVPVIIGGTGIPPTPLVILEIILMYFT